MKLLIYDPLGYAVKNCTFGSVNFGSNNYNSLKLNTTVYGTEIGK